MEKTHTLLPMVRSSLCDCVSVCEDGGGEGREGV